MPRLLRTCVLALCGVALLGAERLPGEYPPDAVLPRAVPHRRRHGAAGVCGTARPHDGGGPVTVPPYLDRPQIVTRTSRAKLALADFDQWAAPLPDTITRVLAENLSLLIPTERVVLHPWPRTIDPDYQVTVEVLQFDRGPGNQVVLAARWSLLDRDGKELALRTSRLSLAAGGADYEATVTAMGRTLEVLAQDMATTLRGMAQPAGGCFTCVGPSQMARPNSYRLMNSPITRSCMRSVLEKQMVRRTSRLIRVRRLMCLLSIFCVFSFPTWCFLVSMCRS